MSADAPAFRMIEKKINNSISYAALIGMNTHPMLRQVISDYKRNINECAILIVDYRKGDPLVRPQEVDELIDQVGDAWSTPERIIFLYDDSNRMRTARFSRLILNRGGNVVALSSWREVRELLGEAVGEDPLEDLETDLAS